MLGINTNVSALTARHSLNRNNNALSLVMEKLSSGKRINSGKDDPAGLIISEHLQAEVRSLQVETETLHRANANANISEGHLREVSSLYTDLQGLVVSSANTAGLSDAERAANQMQIDNIVGSIQKFTGDSVDSLSNLSLPGTGNADLEAALNDAASAAATLASGGANDIDSGNFEDAQAAIDQAISAVASARGEIGAYQRNTVDPAIRANQVAIENVAQANSRIRDTDFAKATSERNRLAILSASNMQVLKIAQNQSKSVLSLLGGMTD